MNRKITPRRGKSTSRRSSAETEVLQLRKPLAGICIGPGGLKRERSSAFSFLELLGRRNGKKIWAGKTKLPLKPPNCQI